jgi:1-phosphofructokinase family hexose kinase
MIVTVTPNTGIDYTLVVPQLQLNATIRSSAQAWGMGGKAIDVAWILGKLGVPVLALGFAAGFSGLQMERMLHERGVASDFIWVDGETRLNIVLVSSDGSGQSTFTSSNLNVSANHLAEFLDRYLAALEKATCLVLGGTLPLGVPVQFYRQVIEQARARDIPVVFDSSGAALKAGIEARPSIVKPNQEELAVLLGSLPTSLTEIRHAAWKLQEMYGTGVIVTLGHEGALALLGENSYQIPPLSLPVASSAGAGDGVSAGMALALSRGEPLENGLRYGFALAGAVVQTLATADFRIEDYEALLSQIKVIPLSPQPSSDDT